MEDMNMELKDITERLSEEQKKRLAEVKTEDDLKKLLIEDEELNKIAGGWYYKQGPGCFSPRTYFRSYGDNNCPKCGAPLTVMDYRCSNCGQTWYFSDDYLEKAYKPYEDAAAPFTPNEDSRVL